MNLVVTSHALERFREHVPDAERADLLLYISHGAPESTDLVQALTGRTVRKTTDRYVVSPNRRGIFVINDCGTVVTYLRMGDTQQNILKPTVTPTVPTVTPTATPKVNTLGFDDVKTCVHTSVQSLFGSTEEVRGMLREPATVEKTDTGYVFSLRGVPLVGVPGGSETVTVYTVAAQKEIAAKKQARQAEREALQEQAYLRDMTARYKDWIQVSSPL